MGNLRNINRFWVLGQIHIHDGVHGDVDGGGDGKCWLWTWQYAQSPHRQASMHTWEGERRRGELQACLRGIIWLGSLRWKDLPRKGSSIPSAGHHLRTWAWVPDYKGGGNGVSTSIHCLWTWCDQLLRSLLPWLAGHHELCLKLWTQVNTCSTAFVRALHTWDSGQDGACENY